MRSTDARTPVALFLPLLRGMAIHIRAEEVDVVLDALDNISSRSMLAKACAEAQIPMIHGAICGWTAQAAIVMPGDGLMERIYPAGAALTSKASLSFTPAFCAALQTALCVRLLSGREVEAGRLYVADLLDMEMERLF